MNNNQEAPPAILTIAGSDSGGGAGIQADLKTFMAHGTYGLSVITAITAQNTQTVLSASRVEPKMVAQQIHAVMDDIDVKAAKTGMLADAQIINAVCDAWQQTIQSKGPIPLVVDPVMVATSGTRLLDEQALDTLRKRLLPLALVVTPNLREAEAILDMAPNSIDSVEAMSRAAREISVRFNTAFTVVKGGHLESEMVIDVVYERAADHVELVTNRRVNTSNTHGTGCTLSAAIAANLGMRQGVADAVRRGISYVNEAMQTGYQVGSGQGPVNHAYALRTMEIAPPTLHTPHPFTQYLKAQTGGLWEQYVQHSFVRQAAAGTLSRQAFIHYLKQDYAFLKHYARATALAAFKSDTLAQVAELVDAMQTCVQESELHVQMCTQWGVSKQEMEDEQESWNNVAYTRYIVDRGMSGDVLELLVAMYPCLLGYGEAALAASADPRSQQADNPFGPWIAAYAGAEFQDAVARGRRVIEDLVRQDMVGGQRLRRLAKTFRDTVDLEVRFWDNALKHN
ncbi:trifunctional hydroxymethylpyrimidine kinase/phosphomethylpyrimidine kinase/thiaminase [Coemansia brasiliensis]|uniref:Trifunctional hydroxymethylpyrimidine kinase/phosphomethylpyrimidine kinase/thiaminase n=1 Tax=Coemansia brasiliensis TaxID=2650707 RepID=A0A9W8IBA0_9FUNG|nr:trifunctional hydroxymethylpyrimidine kinase/phosphomethylpyrimidine kinase/thiaminase [Coemansia brasiliensis]